MPKCRRLLALTVALIASCGSAAVAADGSLSLSQYQIESQTGSILFNPDVIYDYQVWAAPEVTNYYVIATYKNGSVSEYRFSTESGAKQFRTWLYFHIAELKSATIESRVEAGDYVLIQTFDKRADAQDLADLLQSIGLYVQIRSVSLLKFNLP